MHASIGARVVTLLMSVCPFSVGSSITILFKLITWLLDHIFCLYLRYGIYLKVNVSVLNNWANCMRRAHVFFIMFIECFEKDHNVDYYEFLG
jgi:hypothetical protein